MNSVELILFFSELNLVISEPINPISTGCPKKRELFIQVCLLFFGGASLEIIFIILI